MSTLLCLALALGASEATPAPGMTILSYNVLEGFQRGATAEEGVQWIGEAAPDIAGFQELMDISAGEFAALARRWNHPHTAMHKEKGHPVGLSSTAPIEIVEKRTEGLHHGYLHAVTHGIHFLVLHLAPGRPRQEIRKKEAALLAGVIAPLLENQERVVVLGDFNDLSPLDPIPTIRGERPESWDYTVLQTFLDLGLVDACHHMARKQGKGPAMTCPTRYRPPGYDGPEEDLGAWRIDYVLLSPNLAGKLTRAYSPRGAALDRISDHYPVICELQP